MQSALILFRFGAYLTFWQRIYETMYKPPKKGFFILCKFKKRFEMMLPLSFVVAMISIRIIHKYQFEFRILNKYMKPVKR